MSHLGVTDSVARIIKNVAANHKTVGGGSKLTVGSDPKGNETHSVATSLLDAAKCPTLDLHTFSFRKTVCRQRVINDR